VNSFMGPSFENAFNNLYAPCLVANYFKLPGSPFTDEPLATVALKDELARRSGWPRATVEKYTPSELAKILQFDILHESGPLPPETSVGLDRMNRMVKTVTKRDRKDVHSPEFTKEELAMLLTNPCCQTPRVKAVVNAFDSQRKGKVAGAAGTQHIVGSKGHGGAGVHLPAFQTSGHGSFDGSGMAFGGGSQLFDLPGLQGLNAMVGSSSQHPR